MQGPSNMSGGIIDGGYAANDLTIGQCRGETYVFWASADFQNSKNANPHTSLGSRLRYYKPSNGDVNTFAASASVYNLGQSNINSVMWRGIQCAPAPRRAAPLASPCLSLLPVASPHTLLGHFSRFVSSLLQVGSVHGHVQHVPRPQDQHEGHLRHVGELRRHIVVCGRRRCRGRCGRRCRAAALTAHHDECAQRVRRAVAGA